MAITMKIKHPWHGAAVGSLMALAMVLAGCSTALGADGNAAHTSAAAAFSHGLTTAQLKTLFDGQNLLVQQCMERSGYRYPLPRFVPPPATPVAAITNPLYVDASALHAKGYGLGRETTPTAPASSGQAEPASSPSTSAAPDSPSYQQGYQRASFGTNTLSVTLPDGKQISFEPGGCIGKSETELYGSAIQFNVVSIYVADIFDKVRNDAIWSRAWKSAVAAWSGCMTSHGYRYVNELAARVDIISRYQKPGAQPAAVHRYEMRVAAQDAACSSVAKLNSVSLAALRMAEAGLTVDQAHVALEWDQMQTHALSVASEILSHA